MPFTNDACPECKKNFKPLDVRSKNNRFHNGAWLHKACYEKMKINEEVVVHQLSLNFGGGVAGNHIN